MTLFDGRKVEPAARPQYLVVRIIIELLHGKEDDVKGKLLCFLSSVDPQPPLFNILSSAERLYRLIFFSFSDK